MLFNTDMVRALLSGRKTVTRRVVKPQPRAIYHDGKLYKKRGKCFVVAEDNHGGLVRIALPYQPGDILYVRETWTKLFYVDEDGYTHYDQPMYFYAADGTPDITLRDADGFTLDDQRIRWRPSIHMPKEAARIFLRVTDVRVERLQEITEIGARAEGTMPVMTSRVYDEPNEDKAWCAYYSALPAFPQLWDGTIKPTDIGIYGWTANPWVWVIEFERISREGAQRNA